MMRHALAACGLSALLLACADSPSVMILQDQVPGDGCTVGSETNTYLPFGRLDVTPISSTESTGYLLTPVVLNSMTAVEGSSTQNIAFVEGADIELQAGPSTRAQDIIASLATSTGTSRTQRFAAAIQPSAASGLIFYGIAPDQAFAMSSLLEENESVQLILHARVFGQVDFSDFVSPWWDFPVTVCLGCLMRDLGPCSAISAGAELSTGGVCSPLQDGIIDCCDGICPAVGTGS
jgi:hypothetical protein